MNQVYKALAHPIRREILSLLSRGPLPSGEIAAQFDVAAPTVSAHLTKLQHANLVTSVRDGSKIIYSINLTIVEEVAISLLNIMRKDLHDEE